MQSAGQGPVVRGACTCVCVRMYVRVDVKRLDLCKALVKDLSYGVRVRVCVCVCVHMC